MFFCLSLKRLVLDCRGFSWSFDAFRGLSWLFVAFRGLSWLCVAFLDFSWPFMAFVLTMLGITTQMRTRIKDASVSLWPYTSLLYSACMAPLSKKRKENDRKWLLRLGLRQSVTKTLHYILNLMKNCNSWAAIDQVSNIIFFSSEFYVSYFVGLVSVLPVLLS